VTPIGFAPAGAIAEQNLVVSRDYCAHRERTLNYVLDLA
jgi:hypothetical protein